MSGFIKKSNTESLVIHEKNYHIIKKDYITRQRDKLYKYFSLVYSTNNETFDDFIIQRKYELLNKRKKIDKINNELIRDGLIENRNLNGNNENGGECKLKDENRDYDDDLEIKFAKKQKNLNKIKGNSTFKFWLYKILWIIGISFLYVFFAFLSFIVRKPAELMYLATLLFLIFSLLSVKDEVSRELYNAESLIDQLTENVNELNSLQDQYIQLSNNLTNNIVIIKSLTNNTNILIEKLNLTSNVLLAVENNQDSIMQNNQEILQNTNLINNINFILINLNSTFYTKLKKQEEFNSKISQKVLIFNTTSSNLIYNNKMEIDVIRENFVNNTYLKSFLIITEGKISNRTITNMSSLEDTIQYVNCDSGYKALYSFRSCSLGVREYFHTVTVYDESCVFKWEKDSSNSGDTCTLSCYCVLYLT